VPSASWIEAVLSMQQDQKQAVPLAVLAPDGRVCAYVAPALWQLSPQSMLHAFLTERNGIARTLTLPSPADCDASRVVAAMLAALTTRWEQAQSTGDLLRWPSYDTGWLHPLLEQRGFVLDSICALRSRDEPVLVPSPEGAGLLVREATAADEEALVQLFEEELRVHADTVPCARVSLVAIEGFRSKLARRWHGGTLEEGAPLVLVAQMEGQIVGMAECMLLYVDANEEPGWTPPGHYGCLDNVCIHAHARGRGIGTRLVQAALARFASLPDLKGTLLWYSPANRLAADFWPRFGFLPLWTTYQRLHAPVTR
jgi:GNAT superfamily N-acetyltransferase